MGPRRAFWMKLSGAEAEMALKGEVFIERGEEDHYCISQRDDLSIVISWILRDTRWGCIISRPRNKW